MRVPIILLSLCLILPQAVSADPASEALEAMRQQVADLTRTVQQLTATVESQQQRIGELERGNTQVARAPISAPVPSQGAGGGNFSIMNPEIGVVGDIVGQLSESSEDGEGNDALTVREVEVVFGHPIDPYSRLDVTLAFPELEQAELEEAYITHWGLPGEIKARLGRFKPKAGKAIALHRDSLDTVDEPLVIQQYFGAEGMSRTGAELSAFLPVPWTAVTHEVTLAATEGGVGDGGTLFGETLRRPSVYAHLKNFWDISDESNAEFGLSYLMGSKDEDAKYEVHALGLDATLTHYVTPTNKLKWQNEVYLQHRGDSVTYGVDDLGNPFSASVPNTPWGLYSLLDYRLSPRIGLGGRFDYVEPVDVEQDLLARDADTAWSSYLTFYQSEFTRWRLQYRHTDFAAGGDDNTVYLQGTVAIGVHKHQLQ